MPRIMIVDDANFMRASIRRMLEETGYDIVAEAADGVEAVRLYNIHKPDITTMDITMPNMTGLEALIAIRSLDAKAKIVMVSAMGQEGLIHEAITNGASSFIVKPFKQNNLLDILNSI